tara:strand:+ start:1266 stop:3878 length:2613 start_codon:yes stop_codon:yes gene_type:complete
MKNLLMFLFIGSLLFSCGPSIKWMDLNHNGIKDPYEDVDLSFDKRTADLVSKMTLDEKISQMQREAPAIERLGITKYSWGNEGLHGVASWMSGEGFTTTVFPQSIGIASTWNPELVSQEAKVISDEARALANQLDNTKFLSFWSPMINMARDPRWGRTQESYGEDPLLVSEISKAFIQGLQGKDPKYIKTAASIKHFIANNVDYQRHYGSSNISEKLLRDYYFPAFKANVLESNVQIVMSAYNALNEVPCSSNEWLLQEVLRDDWGFEGHVVSDCGAIYNIHANHFYVDSPEKGAASAVLAGTDLNCGGMYTTYLAKAVELGLLTEIDVDKAVKRIITTAMRLGMFDPKEQVPFAQITPDIIEQNAHQELAKEAALQSLVLLKNENNFLPLSKNLTSIAVIGPNANECIYGNYSGKPSKGITPLEGIQEIVSQETQVNYAQGSAIHDFNLPPVENEAFFLTRDRKEKGLKVEFFDNMKLQGKPVLTRIDSNLVHQWWDESQFPSEFVPVDKFSVRWKGVIVPPKSTEYMFSARNTVMSSDDDKGIRIYLDNEIILDQWTSHVGWETGITKKLEAGKAYDFRVEYIDDIDWAAVTIGWKPLKDNLLQEAIEVAKKSDAVIIVLGSRNDTEGEHLDRQSLDLLPEQEKLLQKVYEVNPNIVLTLVNGSPISVNWADENIPAIVEAWYPGQAEGVAIAEVLFGDYNPGGKLPITIPKAASDLPAFEDYDITKGKTYMYQRIEPLYPFGFGLSYTDFEVSNESLLKQQLSKDEVIEISFDLKNMGSMQGSEVVQLYIRKNDEARDNPVKILKAFERVFLAEGEKQRITLSFPIKELARYDLEFDKFTVVNGSYDFMVGNSSTNFYFKKTLEIIE